MEDLHDEEFEPLTVKQVSLKWGLYLGMAMIIYGILLQLMDQVGNQALSYVNYVFLAALMYFAHKSFKDEGNGYMSYGKGLSIGTLMSAVGAVISSIFTYLYLTFIDDSMIKTILEKTEMDMIENGTPEAQIEQVMSMTEKMMTPPIMAILGIVFTVLFGFIISLIISAITKNPDPSTEI